MTETKNVEAAPSELAPSATTTAASAEPAAKPESESVAAAPAAVEPQNALTKKFTEAEWAALKELRVRV